MIKLCRGERPEELTDEMVQQLTDEYKTNGSSVWRKIYITKKLLEYSHGKCAYCECDITEESKYLEVEHFHHKDEYSDEVVKWENLLPSCKKCNSTKGTHDTYKEPIVDPTEQDPKHYFKFKLYRIKGIDELGRMTESVLNLNDYDRHVISRFKIGNAIQVQLENYLNMMEEYESGTSISTLRKNKIINGLKGLMKIALPDREYSATAATVLLTCDDFKTLKEKMANSGLWDCEHNELFDKCNICKFEIN